MHWSSKEKCVKGAGRRLARLSDTLALRFHQCRAARDWPVATRMAPWSHIRSTPAPTLTSNWSDCELPRLLCKPQHPYSGDTLEIQGDRKSTRLNSSHSSI